MRRHLAAHPDHVLHQLRLASRLAERLEDHRLDDGTIIIRGPDRSRAGQRHVFPRPGVFALILCKAVDRYRQQTLRAGGRSEEHTSELQSLMRITYAVYCLKKPTM